MPDYDEKFEINYRGVEYSAYVNKEEDFSKSIDTECPDCGKDTSTFDLKVEIVELFNAETMVQLKNDSSLATAIQEIIKNECMDWFCLCDDCLDARAKDC